MEKLTVGPKAVTGGELKTELAAEREGLPFLVHRDGEGAHHVVRLGDDGGPLWIGRRPSADLCFAWDEEVSGVHAQLEAGGGEWTLVDDGLSRNGSFVNGERVDGRRRLRDGDMLRFGDTVALYRAPGEAPATTLISGDKLLAPSLSETQRRVLIALCRPFKDPSRHATPATNQQIADEVFLGVPAVKVHLRALFGKFGVEDLPQNRKRGAGGGGPAERLDLAASPLAPRGAPDARASSTRRRAGGLPPRGADRARGNGHRLPGRGRPPGPQGGAQDTRPRAG